jgi:NADH:ubiquinone oxidoreductase subunit 5 (subunit L)/multisubunit Na+/H+ antiporter MnhA subunit
VPAKRSFLLAFIRLATLITASLAALREKDAKKVVALSTLSQLGLLYFRLSLGGKLFCLFHLITHAFAKARLFITLGNIIYTQYSEQDLRAKRIEEGFSLNLIIALDIFRLVGILFFRGFYSKEAILATTYSLTNSIFLLVFIIGVVSLTLIYCVLLISRLSFNSSALVEKRRPNLESLISPFVLSLVSCVVGKVTCDNLILNLIPLNRSLGGLWTLLLLGSIFSRLDYSSLKKKSGAVFNIQFKLVVRLKKKFLLLSQEASITALSAIESLFFFRTSRAPLLKLAKSYIIYTLIALRVIVFIL